VLEKVVVIFRVPHNDDDWLSKSIHILKDDSVELEQVKIEIFLTLIKIVGN